MKRLVIPLFVFLLLALVGGAGYLGYRASQPATTGAAQVPPTVAVDRGDVRQTVTAPGQLVGARDQLLSLNIGGRVAHVRVRAGDAVKASDALLQLDDRDLQYALQTAQANLESTQANLNKLEEPPSAAQVNAARAQLASAQSAYNAAAVRYAHNDDQITIAKAALDKATITLQHAQSAYDRVAWRSDVGMSPESKDLQQATIDYQSALANYNLAAADINDSAVKAAAQALAQAQANLTALAAPPDSNQVAVDQAAVDSAQIAVNEAQDKLKQVTLTAPFDGIVQEVRVKQDDSVNAGAPLVQLSDPKALEARCTVTEQDFPLTQVGQTAQLFFDAQPDLSVTGQVMHIVPLRDASSSSPVYPIYIALNNVPAGLAPGMTVDSSILIAKRANVLRLPRALVHARGDGTAQIRVWANGQMQNRAIQVGLRGDQYEEILDGLNEGELVVSR